MTEDSLRERSKARRRAAIEEAALQLFTERGFDGTTINDIAEAAEVSPRTVLGYFGTKLDIVMNGANASASRIVSLLRTRKRGAPLAGTFEQWLRLEDEATDPALRAKRVRMFAVNPGLRGLHSVEMEKAMALGSKALAEQLGRSVDDPHVRVAVAAAAASINEYEKLLADGIDGEVARKAVMKFLLGALDSIRVP
ncbi:MAG: TetR/AcrR family transcriptional regulator [Candidatus Nanopelagicales bacterium]